jgi:septum site-determining protein MinC
MMMETMQQVSVEIKGVQNALLVTFGEGDWLSAEASLLQRVDAQNTFFKGARLVVDVAERELKAADMGKFRDLLSERGVSLWGVLTTSVTTQETARRLGLATQLPGSKPVRRSSERRRAESEEQSEAVLVRKTLRSGMRIEHTGHVTVIGDVNPGAEVVAGGDVVIWGRLRGSVSAGVETNPNAIVCAMEMEPTHLRIADTIANVPARRRGEKRGPEMATIFKNEVIFRTWKK